MMITFVPIDVRMYTGNPNRFEVTVHTNTGSLTGKGNSAAEALENLANQLFNDCDYVNFVQVERYDEPNKI